MVYHVVQYVGAVNHAEKLNFVGLAYPCSNVFEKQKQTFFFQVTTLPEELYPTDVHWFPKSIGAKKQPQSDIFVLTATDGTSNINITQ